MDVVYCILRGVSSPQEAHNKLQDSLQDKGLWKPEFDSKLRAFFGDVSLYHMGLGEDDYSFLSTGVDVIIHCAAQVNLVYPYRGLRTVNVEGTKNALEFAVMGKVKRFSYISTNGVFPECGLVGVKEEDPISALFKEGKLDGASGYTQSKWVAEEIVRRARDEGLPVTIFRPGNLGGDIEVESCEPEFA